jgi:hypothetical protein
MKPEKLISGGQTGVDRGALDAALAAGFPCGGWCPADRAAEDGPIPDRYPLAPLAGGYRERTRQNVLDSDATVILFDGRLSNGRLTGGTRLTRLCSREARKPLLVIDVAQRTPEEAAVAISAFIDANEVRILNVAGPRASGWPGGARTAFAVISKLLKTRGCSPPP